MALKKSVCVAMLSLKYMLPEQACEAAWDNAREYIRKYLNDHPEKRSLTSQPEQFANEAQRIFAEPCAPREITRLALSDDDRLVLCTSVWKAVTDAQNRARKKARKKANEKARAREDHDHPPPRKTYRGITMENTKRLHCQLEDRPGTRTSILLESILEEHPGGKIRSRDLSYTLWKRLIANRYAPPTTDAHSIQSYYKPPENQTIKVYIRDDHALHSAIEDMVASGKTTLLFEVRIIAPMPADRGIELLKDYKSIGRSTKGMIDSLNFSTGTARRLEMNRNEDTRNDSRYENVNEDSLTGTIGSKSSSNDYFSEHGTAFGSTPDAYCDIESNVNEDNLTGNIGSESSANDYFTENNIDFGSEPDDYRDIQSDHYYGNEPHYHSWAYDQYEPGPNDDYGSEPYGYYEPGPCDYYESEPHDYYDAGPGGYYDAEPDDHYEAEPYDYYDDEPDNYYDDDPGDYCESYYDY